MRDSEGQFTPLDRVDTVRVALERSHTGTVCVAPQLDGVVPRA